MHGLHLTADLRDHPVPRPLMTDPPALLAAFEPGRAARSALMRGKHTPQRPLPSAMMGRT